MSPDVSDRWRRVIFVSTSVGAGHNQAAAALMAAVNQARPDVETEFVDALEFARWWFRIYYGGGYAMMVTKLPRCYGMGYDWMNRPQDPGRTRLERLRLLTERCSLVRLRRHLLARRPALVMATHYLAMPMIGRLIGKGVGRLRMFAVITDNEPHRWWFSENVERYFVANEGVEREIRRWGIDPGRITVSGIPIHPKWTAPLDRGKIYRDWRLPDDRPIVVLSGGTFFTVGPIERTARRILDRTDAHVVVLAGNNKKLLARLAGFPEAGGRLTPVAFTDRVHELAEVAAVFITKPGGLITSECIAKGAAMVLTKPVPGQEAANAEMLSGCGAAVVAPTTDAVIAAVLRLLRTPADADAIRANARRLHRPATQTITAALSEAV